MTKAFDEQRQFLLQKAFDLRRSGQPRPAVMIYEKMIERGHADFYVVNGLTRARMDIDGRRARIVWLVSFPRTGSTWLRFLLTHLIHGPFDCSAVVNRVTPTLEYGVELDEMRRDGVIFMKVHDGFESFRNVSQEFIDFSVGVVYVVRHPADVLASFWNYILRQKATVLPEAELPGAFAHYARRFALDGGPDATVDLGYGAYDAHWRGWHDQAHLKPVVDIRYEDIVARPVEALRGVAGQFLPNLDDDSLKAAVGDCSFARMREIEEREAVGIPPDRSRRYDFKERSAIPPPRAHGAERGLRFVNRGESGYGRGMLDPETYATLAETFAPLMAANGYE